MPHETPLITTIVAAFSLAFVFGTLANRLRMPPLVGYLIAGILVGPHTPGFVADQRLAAELAEMGVILLMFGVGLHFSLKDLLSVRVIAIPGAIVQMASGTALGAGLAWLLGWPLGASLIFGLALSVASTVVLLRALQERRLIDTEGGRIAVGWLIVEDLAMILALVMLPVLVETSKTPGATLASTTGLLLGTEAAMALTLTLIKIAAFIAFMLLVGRRLIPWALHGVAHTGSRELFRLAVLVIALGIAFGAAKLFGASFALGAFFAGMILSESELSQRAAQDSLPFRDAFAVLFFVSVGMLFNPMSLLEDPLPILAVVLIIVVGKSLVAFFIVRLFRYPLPTALVISASLAQIGEFSFILAELGVQLQLLPEEARNFIIAGALLSILINPFVFTLLDTVKLRFLPNPFATAFSSRADRPSPGQGSVSSTPAPASSLSKPAGAGLTDHIVLVGFGEVGRFIAQSLANHNMPLLIIEETDKAVSRLPAIGSPLILGNAAKPDILQAANLENANRLIIAIPDVFEAGEIIERTRKIHPALPIVARAYSDAEAKYLTGLGADTVVIGKQEIARRILENIEGK